MKLFHQCFFLLLAVFMAACSPGTIQSALKPTETRTAVLTPYRSSTPTSTRFPSLVKPTQTPLPPPTATPFTHTVKKDETLLGIAFRYGVKLEDLLAANPGVNVHFLSIGTVLIVPLNGELATPAPTAAPPPLEVSAPTCYVAADGNLYCLAEISNPLEEAYENLTMKFSLYAQDGKLLSEQFVIPPLDRLLPDSVLPVMASFSAKQDGKALLQGFSAYLDLLTAVEVSAEDAQAGSSDRYLDAGVQEQQVQISQDALSAQITGKITALEGTGSIWLVAVAYDRNKHPVGLRRLEMDEICPLEASVTPVATALSGEAPVCAELPFDLLVYSLGPTIKGVELFVEAHR